MPAEKEMLKTLMERPHGCRIKTQGTNKSQEAHPRNVRFVFYLVMPGQARRRDSSSRLQNWMVILPFTLPGPLSTLDMTMGPAAFKNPITT